ncbi:hypothetical protein PENSPDRAFT_91858 [Peniophora sp. CONT]|nr:hypothetical protein PENSPDRAFT_91858 [Peniophora sp. CONT]
MLQPMRGAQRSSIPAEFASLNHNSDLPPGRPAKRQKVVNQVQPNFTPARRTLPRFKKRLIESTPEVSLTVDRRKINPALLSSKTAAIEISDDEVGTVPPSAQKSKGKTPVRVAHSNFPTAGHEVSPASATTSATCAAPAAATTATLSSAPDPSRPTSSSNGRTLAVACKPTPATECSRSAQQAPSSTYALSGEQGPPSAPPIKDRAAADTSHACNVPTSSQDAATHSGQSISVSAVKTLLDLRKSSLEVLTEEQLPDELRVDNIRRLLGRAAAGVVDAGNAGASG